MRYLKIINGNKASILTCSDSNCTIFTTTILMKFSIESSWYILDTWNINVENHNCYFGLSFIQCIDCTMYNVKHVNKMCVSSPLQKINKK